MSAASGPTGNPGEMTFEEFLAWEEEQEEKHEFASGRVFAMAGASDNHELVAGNLFAALLFHLRGKGCRVYKSDMKARVRLGRVELSYYPDVMVVCDPADDHPSYKERPKLLAEVMSDFKQDQIEKLFIYQQIEALEEYLVVEPAPDAPRAWVYRRAEGWKPPEPISGGEVALLSVGLRLDLAELFQT